ncbi:MAG: T9SS type A sorting domain-containing protein, partial [Bacteroidia bacterium]
PIISGGSDETFCGSGIITFANKQNVNPMGGTFYNTNQQQVTTFDVATAAVLPQENKFIYQIPVSSGSVVCLGTDTFVYLVVPAAQLTSISGNLTPIKNTIQTYTTNANPYHNYSWQITGGQIQSNSQNSATVLWGNAGNGSIKVIARHPSCNDFELNQQVQITPSTGLTEQAIIPNLLIYPNPANNSVTVSFESDKTAQIELLTAMMQNITEYNVLPNQGSVEKQIPTSTLSSGLYFIRIQVNGQSGMYKLIISR